MTAQSIYEKPAQRLDQGIVASPPSPALLKILEILFPGKEAEVALLLAMENRTLTELRELFKERTDTDIFTGLVGLASF